MNLRVELACLLAIAVMANACAPSVTRMPTRTPKPTFTTVSSTATPEGSLTDTPDFSTSSVSTAAPGATGASVSTATSGPTGAQVSTGTPQAMATDTATLTAAAGPTDTPATTATPVPTDTPPPTATPLPCPAGYAYHLDAKTGFSACYPTGWVVAEYEDPEQMIRWASFDSPTMDADTGAGFKMITVTASPNSASSEEEALRIATEELTETFGQVFVSPPEELVVDGRRAIQAHYEIHLAFGDVQEEDLEDIELAEIPLTTWWETVFVTDERQWTILIAGRSEYLAELEDIRSQFLSEFHVLPPQ